MDNQTGVEKRAGVPLAQDMQVIDQVIAGMYKGPIQVSPEQWAIINGAWGRIREAKSLGE